ncbi:unnamed protein product, partial [Oppiella nova]
FQFIIPVHPYVPEVLSTCEDWKAVCQNAQYSQLDNYYCYGSSVFFYESTPVGWDESRQLCSQKFSAKYEADLVQLSNDKKEAAKEMMKRLYTTGIITVETIELATSGVCCMRKLTADAFGTDCQWLATGTPIENTKISSQDKCIIYTWFRKGGRHITYLPVRIQCSEKLAPPVTTSTPSDTTTVSGSSTTDISPDQTTTLSPADIDKVLQELEDKLSDPNITKTEILNCSGVLSDILTGGPLVTNSSLNRTLNIIDNLQQKVHNKIKDTDYLRKFTENIVQICSNVLDCDRAWDQINHNDVKSSFSSNILQYMQRSTFALGCTERTDTSHKPIKRNNIVVQTFTMDYNKTTTFQVQHMDSSITIPAGIPAQKPDENCNAGTAVGAVFDKLSRYLK